jgi:hypothetical protein
MNYNRFWYSAVLSAGIIVATFGRFLAASPSEDNEFSRQPPQAETFQQRHPAVEEPTWNGDYKYNLSQVEEENGRVFGNLTLFGLRRIDCDTRESYRVQYGRLYEGDIAPIFTALYRVAEADPNENWITVKRIDESKFLNEIGVKPESYALPLNAGVRIAAVQFQVKSITPGKDKKSGPVARLIASYVVPTETVVAKGIERNFSQLRAGDLVEVADSKYKVRKIVPPDAKRQVVGWVELTPIRKKDAVRKSDDEKKSKDTDAAKE